jgi:uncharacterized protein YdiU (UPF0061 family)
MLTPGFHAPTLVWQNRFAQLGSAFHTRWSTTPLPNPQWVAWSDALALELGWGPDWRQADDMLQILTGNQPWPGSEPLASVYSGHQFGVWAGQLGDGRALWLGEIDTPLGPREIQLKGAGPTPYSRRGDGRAVLRSSIREFLCSEAMHGLGIPTTRALALVGADAPVWRESQETAAVVTRVSPSFIRFGHFEHFAAADRRAELQQLLRFCVQQLHVGEDHGDDLAQTALTLLRDVLERTARLMAAWQSVGFCHGVMNTDNMSILGLTLDYGPFQFMDAFKPHHICNHTDSQGRYAFDQQPKVSHWNLYALGQALTPLVNDTQPILDVLETYPACFQAAWLARMQDKLGLHHDPAHVSLIEPLMDLLAQNRVDHTLFWRRLSHAVLNWQSGQSQDRAFEPVTDLVLDRPALQDWLQSMFTAWVQKGVTDTGVQMLRSNPKYVLRNHLAELAIRDSRQGNHQMVRDLLKVLQSPYDEHPGHEAWAGLPPDWAQHIEISCSS